MPATQPAILTLGLRKLTRDLRKMGLEAPREVRATLKDSLAPMVAHARDRTRKGVTGRLAGSWRGTARGSSAAITSNHPGMRVNEFGGTIRPHGGAIEFEPQEAMYGRDGALAVERPNVERRLRENMEKLAHRNGWRG